MADPTAVQQVADHAGSIGAIVSYYAPAFFAVASPFVAAYVKPVIDAIVRLPGLLEAQNKLLQTANDQRDKKI